MPGTRARRVDVAAPQVDDAASVDVHAEGSADLVLVDEVRREGVAHGCEARSAAPVHGHIAGAAIRSVPVAAGDDILAHLERAVRHSVPKPTALVLNYPLGFEGHWVPVIAERESVAFREQPFFSGAEPYYERTAALSDTYFNPAGEDAYALVREYGVTHLIVPQIVGDPAYFSDMRAMIRWRWPEDTWRAPVSLPSEADWLELLFEQDGAQVYRVVPAE